MRSVVLCILFLICWSTDYCQDNTAILRQLDKVIGESETYDRQKLQTIATLKQSLAESKSADLFNNYRALYDEYMIFNFDSAYTYARKQLEVALQQNNDSLVSYAKIKLSFILLSSGMFKEAFDSLNAIHPGQLSGNSKQEYFTLLARCYYDLADYDNDRYHTPGYNKEGNRLIDSAISLFATGSFPYDYYNGLKLIRAGNIDGAMQYFKKLMSDSTTLSLHQLALTASTLSDIYIQRGQTDTAIRLLVQAAIADIQSSTKETAASFNLATLLFKQGDLKNASTYIEKAVNDAAFYGARQRKVQLSAILSLIEGEKINRVESEKSTVITYAVIVTLLLVLLVILTIIVFRQVQKLKLAKQTITQAHTHQQEINARLVEANKIKEEYIGYFFNGNSEFYNRLERFKKNVEQKVADRKLDEIRFLVNNLNIKHEKDELLINFDRIFLKLFPNFITSYNALFKSDDQVPLKENETLNTDLRIFALIRLGIHDNEKIAQILGYSVNTINTYKTKVKNKSFVVNEEFEQKIMDIEPV
jgi:tetratricopeptide (TPR) repeat protein